MENTESQYKNASILLAGIIRPAAPVTEEPAASMKEILKRFSEIITIYKGTVERAAGYHFIAHFGVDSVMENTPHRAVNAALAIRKSLGEYCARSGPVQSLKLRVGIGTGPVFVGRLPDMPREQMLTGNALQVASLLEERARENGILVCPATRRATADHFTYAEAGTVSVPDQRGPVAMYELLSTGERPYTRPPVEERRVPTGRGRMVQSVMVGRDREISLLKEKVQALKQGRGGIITVTGEAGIGKSRLLAELKASPEMRDAGLLEGRALSIGQIMSFHPLIDLLKNWAQIRDDDSSAASFAKLESSIKRVHPGQAQEIIPFIATLMGMELPGEYEKRVRGIEGEALEKLIYRNVREFLIKGADIRPLVLHFEDMHWADTSSLDLIMSLFSLVKKHRLLFVLVFRPGYGETGERVMRSLENEFHSLHTHIRLEQLDSRQSGILMENLLCAAGFPQGLKDDIIARSDGNPFFIEEVVRSLIDRGAVELKNDAFIVTAKITEVAVPSSIEEVLLSRIESFDPETRDLVKIASVIGRSFFYRIIVRVAVNIRDINERLAVLRDMELLREQVRLDELEYIFKHALAQEAAYAAIGEERKKQLHRQVAAAIKEEFSGRLNDFYGMLAWHYMQSGDLESAEEYMIRAGEEALRTSASKEAFHYFNNTLQLYKKSSIKYDKEKLVHIERNIASALYNTGSHRQVAPYFQSVLAYKGVRFYQNKFFHNLSFLYNMSALIVKSYMMPLGKNDPSPAVNELYDLYYKYVAGLGNVNPLLFFTEVMRIGNRFYRYDVTKLKNGFSFYMGGSFIFSWSGFSFRLASRFIKKLSKLIHEDDAVNRLDLLEALIYHDYLKGEWANLSRYADAEETVEQNLRLGRVYDVIMLYYSLLPDWFMEMGMFRDARVRLDRIRQIGEMYRHQTGDLCYTVSHSLLLTKSRRFSDALSEIERGIPLMSETGMPGFSVKLYSLLSLIHLLNGREGEAESALGSAEKIVSGEVLAPYHVSPYYLARLLQNLAGLEKAVTEHNRHDLPVLKAKSLSAAKQALRVVRMVASDRTEARRHRGTVHWLLAFSAEKNLLRFGKILSGVRAKRHYRKALQWWKRSIDEGERLGARLELSRSYFEVGKRCAGVGAGRDLPLHPKINTIIGLTPEQCLEKAEAMFRDMNLTWDLEQLRKIKPQ
ncbi:MAG TPA: AAA family ATPase [Spirochaetota bacterium]|nr:AAA family ATPase [Spirochaetota bacterium]HPI88973.1 AAA family ATPase [Spirochaetota bacterium]HPR47460.1 AAA family ATPase [Spirochaetota bacterium]